MTSLAIIVFTLWVAVVALASLVVRVVGAARVKKFPVTIGIVSLALLAAPVGALFKIAKPVYARMRPWIRHAESPALPASCPVFPADNVWNASVRNLPVATDSARFVQTIGADAPLHDDFGRRAGYEFAVATQDLPIAAMTVGDYPQESDPGPYHIPDNAPREPSGDRHVLVLDAFHCRLYELFGATQMGPLQWTVASAAIFDLRSNQLRPDTWTSADASGLPILPGLVKYDEVKSGRIAHALRFTAPVTRNTYVWPARHKASSNADPALPPMGQRFRLRSSFDISGFSPETRTILTALQDYGMLLADNGGKWFVSGALDSRWPAKIHEEMRLVHGSDFEAVDSTGLMTDRNSGQAGH
jgi:hypothetical protein